MSFSKKYLWNNFWINRDTKIEYENCKESNITMMISSNIFIENNVNVIKDCWCGNYVFREYLKNINYIGIDGTDTCYQDKII
jgi:hypothetical protein